MTGGVRVGRLRALLARGSASIVFVVTLGLFVLGASQRDPWRIDEHRYAEVARVMTTPAGSWLVPHLNGEVYAHKPPAFFWIVALMHELLELPLGAAAKAASAVASASTVALTFALGRRLGGAWLGLVAAAVLASAEMSLSLALRANLDALLTACTTASLYAYWRAHEAWRDGRASCSRWVLCSGLCAGLAVLVKGPVGLFIPTIVIVVHAAWCREGPVRWSPAWLGAGMLALAPAFLWLAAAVAEAGTGYGRDLVLGHGVGHPLGQVGKQRPFWFYFKELPQGLLPWSFGLPAALLLVGRSSSRAGDAFLLTWLLAPLLALSVFPAKRHLYLLPLYPGAALLLGRWLVEVVSGDEARMASRALRAFSHLGRLGLGASGLIAGLLLCIGALSTAAGWTDLLVADCEPLGPAAALGPLPWLGALVSGSVLASSGLGFLRRTSRGLARVACLGLGFGTFLLFALVVHPIESAGRSTTTFYREVRALVGDDPIAYYGGRSWDANWLLERSVVPDIAFPRDRERFAELAETGQTRWLVAETGYLHRLGWPTGFCEVLRVERAFEATLLLLRSGPPKPGESLGRCGALPLEPGARPALGQPATRSGRRPRRGRGRGRSRGAAGASSRSPAPCRTRRRGPPARPRRGASASTGSRRGGSRSRATGPGSGRPPAPR